MKKIENAGDNEIWNKFSAICGQLAHPSVPMSELSSAQNDAAADIFMRIFMIKVAAGDTNDTAVAEFLSYVSRSIIIAGVVDKDYVALKKITQKVFDITPGSFFTDILKAAGNRTLPNYLRMIAGQIEDMR